MCELTPDLEAIVPANYSLPNPRGRSVGNGGTKPEVAKAFGGGESVGSHGCLLVAPLFRREPVS